jgi:type VI protein secretion system component VasK
MSVVKSLWASIQGDPRFMRRLNGWLTIFWIVMIPVSILTGWISSVTYVAALSLWALVSGHWSAWQAARVEVKQEKEEEKEDEKQEDLPAEIAERVVELLQAQHVAPTSSSDRPATDPLNAALP